jgi:hypothetical protein
MAELNLQTNDKIHYAKNAAPHLIFNQLSPTQKLPLRVAVRFCMGRSLLRTEGICVDVSFNNRPHNSQQKTDQTRAGTD